MWLTEKSGVAERCSSYNGIKRPRTYLSLFYVHISLFHSPTIFHAPSREGVGSMFSVASSKSLHTLSLLLLRLYSWFSRAFLPSAIHTNVNARHTAVALLSSRTKNSIPKCPWLLPYSLTLLRNTKLHRVPSKSRTNSSFVTRIFYTFSEIRKLNSILEQ